MTSFYQYSFEDLQRLCQEQGLPIASAALLYNWHYKKNQRAELKHQDLSLKARDFVSRNLDFTLLETEEVYQSADATVKFLWRLSDGLKIESVLIPFQGKYTLCLSSQVGCAMNCSFCFTGTQGLSRHLKVEEIIGQFLQARSWLSQNRPGQDRILNLVFMGQGEPLHNFDGVKKACEIFLSQYGISLSAAKITVSTSGYLPGLLRWKKEMPMVNIALSLHSVDAKKRAEIIPLEKKYPVEDLLPLLDLIPEGKNRFVTYEYLMLKGFNDSLAEAHALGNKIRGKKAYINLIPFNPFPGSEFQRPEEQTVEAFKQILDTYQIPTTIRKTKGDAILAACGQLNSK